MKINDDEDKKLLDGILEKCTEINKSLTEKPGTNFKELA